MDPKKPVNEFDDQLDDEERKIHAALMRGEYVVSPNQTEMKKELKQAALNTLRRKSITLRLQESDIRRMKVKALEQGVPYQTLISSVIHQFAAGRLVPKS